MFLHTFNALGDVEEFREEAKDKDRLIPFPGPGELVYLTTYQWRKKMFLNRGTVNKIVCKVRKNFFGSHNTPSNHAHYYANLAVK